MNNKIDDNSFQPIEEDNCTFALREIRGPRLEQYMKEIFELYQNQDHYEKLYEEFNKREQEAAELKHAADPIQSDSPELQVGNGEEERELQLEHDILSAEYDSDVRSAQQIRHST